MRIYTFIFLILLTLIFGCSSSNSVISPKPDTNPVNSAIYLVDGTNSLGLFNLHVNPEELTAELIPLRESSLIDTLEVVDITNFLLLAPCSDCAKINSVSIVGKYALKETLPLVIKDMQPM